MQDILRSDSTAKKIDLERDREAILLKNITLLMDKRFNDVATSYTSFQGTVLEALAKFNANSAGQKKVRKNLTNDKTVGFDDVDED